LARNTQALCRICRRENLKLFLKGTRCFSDKCSFDRRSYAPGQHGQKRVKYSDYGIQLREKQKVKRIYSLSEKQFRLLFEKADRMKGITGENLLILLERRIDNVLFRLGIASSRNQARQLVSHNHFLLNGRNINIPSYIVRINDIIEIKEKSKNMKHIIETLNTEMRHILPHWIEFNKEEKKAIIKSYPIRDDITIPIQEQLIIELYSK